MSIKAASKTSFLEDKNLLRFLCPDKITFLGSFFGIKGLRASGRGIQSGKQEKRKLWRDEDLYSDTLFWSWTFELPSNGTFIQLIPNLTDAHLPFSIPSEVMPKLFQSQASFKKVVKCNAAFKTGPCKDLKLSPNSIKTFRWMYNQAFELNQCKWFNFIFDVHVLLKIRINLNINNNIPVYLVYSRDCEVTRHQPRTCLFRSFLSRKAFWHWTHVKGRTLSWTEREQGATNSKLTDWTWRTC